MKWIWIGMALAVAGGTTCQAQAEQGLPPVPGAPEEMTAAEPAPEAVKEKEANMVIIKTSAGDIKVRLNAEKAPLTVANFLAYADDGHYNGTIFHRVIDGFMIQGGGFDAQMKQKPTKPPVKNEAANGLHNKRGTLAMARTPIVDSATSQFFINVKDNGFLDHRSPDPRGFGYCVFGEVVDGMDVVDQIKGVATGVKAGMPDVPLEPVEILSVTRAE